MTKKRFFTKGKKKIVRHPRGKYEIGNKSVITRESMQPPVVAQEKKELTQPRKTETKKPQFPNIYQIITEQKSLWVFYAILLAFSLWQLGSIGIQAFELQKVFVQRSQLENNMRLWENIAQKYPGYRDAYFQAALLAYQLGDSTKEKAYLDKTFQIDPNYQSAQNLEKISQ